ncbi:hypothetical protein LCGC14_0953160 [marine sediment metagenome]|uniref:Uncharacterized protein n=1 Tax=marine sediment metagenome TaxID=412755 RepID=A0A0F9NGM5_9ZZZZ
MTTLEERRQWMRDGCPLKEANRRDGGMFGGDCDVFYLYILDRLGRIIVRCVNCGASATSHHTIDGGMELIGELAQADIDAGKRLAVDGVKTAIDAVGKWIGDHAWLLAETAEDELFKEGYEGVAHRPEVARWIVERMHWKTLEEQILVGSGCVYVLEGDEEEKDIDIARVKEQAGWPA